MPKIEHSELIRILNYDGATGVFHWRIATARKIKIGQVAGTPHSAGYVTITLYNQTYYAHSLAWFYVYKLWPTMLPDHINRNKSDNSINNLREATYSQNAGNTRPHIDSMVPYKGVRKMRSKFQSRLYDGVKTHYLGTFVYAVEAAEAYDKAALQHFGQFALTNQQLGLLP